MPEKKQRDFDVSDFLDLPNGREEYAQRMLALGRHPADRHTDGEKLEIYRGQFDYALLRRRLMRGEITPEEFNKQEHELDKSIRKIKQALHAREVQRAVDAGAL